jgi:hypothetical protein
VVAAEIRDVRRDIDLKEQDHPLTALAHRPAAFSSASWLRAVVPWPPSLVPRPGYRQEVNSAVIPPMFANSA